MVAFWPFWNCCSKIMVWPFDVFWMMKKIVPFKAYFGKIWTKLTIFNLKKIKMNKLFYKFSSKNWPLFFPHFIFKDLAFSDIAFWQIFNFSGPVNPVKNHTFRWRYNNIVRIISFSSNFMDTWLIFEQKTSTRAVISQ